MDSVTEVQVGSLFFVDGYLMGMLRRNRDRSYRCWWINGHVRETYLVGSRREAIAWLKKMQKDSEAETHGSH